MHLQNRVTPFGEIVAISQRGLFTRNRGIIHDPTTRTLLPKRWAIKTWLVCDCDYGNCRREIMAGRSWTELFFLDEAVALSAGHRRCFLCRRQSAERFRACWASAMKKSRPSAVDIDGVLHAERIECGRKHLHPITETLAELPDGAIVACGDQAFTLRAGCAHPWTNEGYGPPRRLAQADGLLTPPSTVMAPRAGYQPVFHTSINTPPDRSYHARSV